MSTELRSLTTLEGVQAAEALFATVWRSPGTPPFTAEVMRAIEHAGGYVVGAFDGSTMLGASAGFLGMGPHSRPRLHSHISGVLPEAQGRQVGWALKLNQRAWALERGIDEITWTYDPLVRRNGWFNLGKLGAEGTEYLVDFYGQMTDGINAGEHTDRLFVVWDLLSPRVRAAAQGNAVPASPEGAVVLLDERDGLPVRGDDAGEGPALIRLPSDIERLRNDVPEAARAWRMAVREALEPLLSAGHRVTGVTRDGDLVVAR
jgi:predicted GNAT superfamily acetyltransferase